LRLFRLIQPATEAGFFSANNPIWRNVRRHLRSRVIVGREPLAGAGSIAGAVGILVHDRIEADPRVVTPHAGPDKIGPAIRAVARADGFVLAPFMRHAGWQLDLSGLPGLAIGHVISSAIHAVCPALRSPSQLALSEPPGD
jgi:hypothetical protein